MSAKHWMITAALLAAGFGLSSCSSSETIALRVGDEVALPVAIGGIADVGDGWFLGVRDSRGDGPPGQVVDDRLGVFRLGSEWLPLAFASSEAPPRDLESAARDPRAPGRILVLESGSFGGTRRLFSLAVRPCAAGGFEVREVEAPLDLREITPDLDNVEGMIATADQDGALHLILCDRSVALRSADGSAIGRLAHLRIHDREVRREGSPTDLVIDLPDGNDWRICGELALAPWGDVFAIACRDPIEAGTGFESRIYRLGTVRGGSFSTAVSLATVLPGHKFEALVLPGPGMQFVMASDDEQELGTCRSGQIEVPASWAVRVGGQ